MAEYKLTINGSAVYGDLTWNGNGSLKTQAITDPFNAADAQTCNYLYDDVARLASVDCGATKWQQNFAYDLFGNISKSVPTGGTGLAFQPVYGSATNRYTSIPGGTPSYDANGNLLNDSFHSYTWDAYNRPITVDSLGLTYDAFGHEVELQSGTNYTEYVYALGQKLAIMTGQTLSKGLITLPGGAQVKYSSSGISTYRLPDWLGSLRVGSNPNRTYSWGIAFAPFGERYAPMGSPAYTFTGQDEDTATGMYDFQMRELHNSQGRWTSPDPAGLAAVDLSNPQTWNRYAYVNNNPLSHTDPSGLVDDAIGCKVDCGGGGVFAAPDFFQTGLDASNRNVDFSFDHFVDWNNHQTFGGKYYDLPGHSNPIQQALGLYQGQVNQAFAEANTARANDGTAACIANGLQATFPGSSVTAGESTGEVGGHWNFYVTLEFASQSAFNKFNFTYEASATNGMPPPARFRSGPALHLENLGDFGDTSVVGTAHIDLFNPNPTSMGGGGFFGLAGHAGIDGVWGHIAQFLGGNIDPKACPF